MKKVSVIAAVGLLASGAAFAGFVEVAGNPETIVTVEQIAQMRDEMPVVMQGKIVQNMGDEKYLFQDGTGSIAVEIDDEDWAGQTVSPANTVKIYGEVDTGLFKDEIDVDKIMIVE